MSQKKDPLKSLQDVQIKIGEKSGPDATKLYILKENKSASCTSNLRYNAIIVYIRRTTPVMYAIIFL